MHSMVIQDHCKTSIESNHMLVLHTIKYSQSVADKTFDYHQTVYVQISEVLG